MSIIATAVRHLMAAGVTGEALVAAIAEMEAAQPKDAAAERRRAWDRERKRKAKEVANSTGIPPESAENAETPSLPLPPKDNNSNPPAPTHPGNTTRARKSPADKPDDVEDQVWSDFIELRRSKRAPLTPTALAGIRREAEDVGWPLNRALSEAVTRGWQSFKSEWITEGKQAHASNRNNSRPRPAEHVDNRDGFTRAIDELAFGAGCSPH